MDDAIIEQARQALYKQADEAAKRLNKIPGISSGPMGLTPDSVRNSPQYKKAKADYDKLHMAIRKFNTQHKPKRHSQLDRNGMPIKSNAFAKRLLAANPVLEEVDEFLSRKQVGKYEIYENRRIIIVDFQKNKIMHFEPEELIDFSQILKKHGMAVNMFTDRGYLVWHIGK